MPERVCYFNGQMVPETQAVVPVMDRGFLYGDAVYDIARSFGHRPFAVREHLERLYRSARYLRIDPGMPIEKMERITLDVFERNRPLLGEHEDYTLVQRIARGPCAEDNPLTAGPPTVVVMTPPVKFRSFARAYQEGIHVVTPSVRRTPPVCIDSRAKIQNKANHILADIEAKQVDPRAYSLMLDLNGHIAENSAANFFMVKGGVLITPTDLNALSGITRGHLIRLAREAGIPVEEANLTLYDAYNADEAFLTTTSPVILPIARINGLSVPGPLPGPITALLLRAWSSMVGVDIVKQALSHLG